MPKTIKMKDLEKVDAKIQELKSKSRQLLDELQGICPHPKESLVKYHGYIVSYDCYILCKACGLAAEIDLGRSIFPVDDPQYDDDFPSCSLNTFYKLSRRRLDAGDNGELYKLGFPMRHSPESLRELRNNIGKPLFDRYINRNDHLAGGWCKFTDDYLDE